jgi:hypothetical protein
MLRTLEYHTDNVDGNPSSCLIKAAALAPAREALDIVAHARARASAIVREAIKSAKLANRDGYCEGVRAGVEAAVEPMFGMIAQLEQVQWAFAAKARLQVRQSMETLLENGSVLEPLIHVVLARHREDDEGEVQITLPQIAADQEERILAHCESAGIHVSVVVSPTESFSIDWNGHRWEALPAVVAAGIPQRIDEAWVTREDAIGACTDALTSSIQRLRSASWDGSSDVPSS